MFDRSERRHHIERLKEARKEYYGYGGRNEHGRIAMTPKQLGKVVTNAKNCSCQMCRNPRHSTWYKGADKCTIQERSQIEALKTYELESEE